MADSAASEPIAILASLMQVNLLKLIRDSNWAEYGR
jgi:hypothetical protein